ncbi:MAG: iron transporter [Azoarcus sp.]|jgi:hypothetical protein|nr:iron transporter [Azoarcus sp.]
MRNGNVPVFRASARSIASRALAALLGGYALASAFTAFFSLALPLHPGEAVLTASLLGFVVYVAAVISVFGAGSAARAWGWMLGPSLLLTAGTWLLGSLR